MTHAFHFSARRPPVNFYGAVGGKEVVDGTLNRFLVFSVETLGAFNKKTAGINKTPPELVARVRALADRSGGPDFRVKSMPEMMRLDGYKKPVVMFVPWGAGAEDIWDAYLDQCRFLAHKDNCRDMLGRRCSQNAIKVATILAISENPVDPVVHVHHVKLGLLLAEASLRDMMGGYEQNVGDSKTADLQDRVLGRIRKAKGGVISKRELFGSLRKAFDSMQKFDDVMKILAAARQATIAFSPGRRIFCWSNIAAACAMIALAIESFPAPRPQQNHASLTGLVGGSRPPAMAWKNLISLDDIGRPYMAFRTARQPFQETPLNHDPRSSLSLRKSEMVVIGPPGARDRRDAGRSSAHHGCCAHRS